MKNVNDNSCTQRTSDDIMENIEDSNIGVEGAKMISESLKTNTTLAKLNLSGDEK